MKKITTLLILLVIVLLSVSACTSGVSQQNYNDISQKLSAAQTQITELQGKLAAAEKLKGELQKQYDSVKSELDTLKAKPDDLQKKYDAVKSELDTLKASYDRLNAQYQDLNQKYNAINVTTTAIPSEPDIEQQVFKSINLDRTTNGLKELTWGPNLYSWALENSKNMARDKKLQYSTYGAFQEVQWVAGYNTAETMAKAVVTVWKAGDQYQKKFLNSGTLFGAVAVYKLGDVYYITYIGDFFK